MASLAVPQSKAAPAAPPDPTVDLQLFLFGEAKMFLFGVKSAAPMDFMKNAVWAAFGYKEGTFRLRLPDTPLPVDHQVALSTLLDPNTFDVSGKRVLRLDIIPGDDFIR